VTRRPDITRPPRASQGCDDCCTPIGGRHEWSCPQVPADVFIAALNAPPRRRFRWQRLTRPAMFLAAGIWFTAAVVTHDLIDILIGAGFLLVALTYRRH
jgi:hypothetical protein